MSFGCLFTSVVGYLTESWRSVAWVLAALPLAPLVTQAIVMKESPYWLVEQGRNEEARLEVF